MPGEYKAFYKTVGGNEGGKCHYPTRLDTYGKGCQHDCKYCYAKSLLAFRGIWDASEPAAADIEKVRRRVARLEPGGVVRLGGMTDCLQPIERERRVTLETIRALNERGVHQLIVTKSAMVAEPEYLEALGHGLSHVQVTVTTTDDALSATYEHASRPSDRIRAIEALQDAGVDVALRLSPFIPEFVDLDALNAVRCDKVVVEFLRVNHWIRKTFDMDYSEYTLRQGSYWHLPLARKVELLGGITGFREVTVCEDEDEAYAYWRDNFNPNPDDCCNLRL